MEENIYKKFKWIFKNLKVNSKINVNTISTFKIETTINSFMT